MKQYLGVIYMTMSVVTIAGFIIYFIVIRPQKEIVENGPKLFLIHGIDTAYWIPPNDGRVRYRDEHGVWQTEYFQKWELTEIKKP